MPESNSPDNLHDSHPEKEASQQEVHPHVQEAKAEKDSEHPKPRRGRGFWLVVVAAVLVTGAGSAAAFKFLRAKRPVVVATSTPTPTPDIQPEVVVATPTPVPTATPAPGIANLHGATWLATPVALGDLGFFTAAGLKDFSDSAGATKPTYYQVGSDSGRKIIMLAIPPQGPGNPYPMYALEASIGKYVILGRHEGGGLKNNDVTYYGPELTSKVTFDTTSAYPELAYQKTLTYKGQTLTSGGAYYGVFQSVKQGLDPKTQRLDRLTTVSAGDLYLYQLGIGDGFAIQSYLLNYKGQATNELQFRPSFVKADNVPQVTWNDGKANTDTYRTDGIGSCGSAMGLAVLNDLPDSSLAVAGKTATGEKIYEVIDQNNQTLNYFYGKYSVDYQGKPVPGIMSKADYLAHHAVFIYIDALGRKIVFSTYGSQGECGKPVIYLYPTSTTAVHVGVGANVTKSEPIYGSGWDVIANPDGSLLWWGKRYSSLFWEGTGHGVYPAITSGSIVARADLYTTLKAQMTQLGLNAKEQADFLEFWWPKMPMSAYTRLTWFGTTQMDQLAPLDISPKPDTVIRVFLDFEGLAAPIDLPSQTLSAPARRGFTVVEWGGLLR